MSDYPTDFDLQRISAWPFNDPLGWVDFACFIWHWPDWGIHRTQRRVYMSTGGWSGNEEIVGAMRANVLWKVGFVSCRRGGHYIFDLTRLRTAQEWRKAARLKEGREPSGSDAPASRRRSGRCRPGSA